MSSYQGGYQTEKINFPAIAHRGAGSRQSLPPNRVSGSEAGEDAREPAGQAGFPCSKIFGGFRISLTALPSSCSPRTGYIQGRFSGCVVLFCTVQTFRFAVGELLNSALCAHTHGFTPVARLSVTTLPMVAPLPPSISLRSLRSLRLNFSWSDRMSAIQKGVRPQRQMNEISWELLGIYKICGKYRKNSRLLFSVVDCLMSTSRRVLSASQLVFGFRFGKHNPGLSFRLYLLR